MVTSKAQVTHCLWCFNGHSSFVINLLHLSSAIILQSLKRLPSHLYCSVPKDEDVIKLWASKKLLLFFSFLKGNVFSILWGGDTIQGPPPIFHLLFKSSQALSRHLIRPSVSNEKSFHCPSHAWPRPNFDTPWAHAEWHGQRSTKDACCPLDPSSHHPQTEKTVMSCRWSML